MAAARRKTTEFLVQSQNCVGCLECQLRCSVVHHRIFNPRLANIRVIPSADASPYYRVSYLDSCVKCGSCVRACSFDTLRFTSTSKEDAHPEP